MKVNRESLKDGAFAAGFVAGTGELGTLLLSEHAATQKGGTLVDVLSQTVQNMAHINFSPWFSVRDLYVPVPPALLLGGLSLLTGVAAYGVSRFAERRSQLKAARNARSFS